MFDISWTEFLLIGVVALIVIGPKELPTVLRTLGQWTRKVRSMATDFQNQFQEAMREAEMADLKKQVDDMARDFKNFDPLKDVRDRSRDDRARMSRIARSRHAGAKPARAGVGGDAAGRTMPAPAAESPRLSRAVNARSRACRRRSAEDRARRGCRQPASTERPA